MIPKNQTEMLRRLGERIASARLAKNWPQAQLALEAGVSSATLRRLESGKSVQLSNWLRVLAALGMSALLGALLQAEPSDPIAELEFERMRMKRQRKRASTARKPQPSQEADWTWGEDR